MFVCETEGEFDITLSVTRGLIQHTLSILLCIMSHVQYREIGNFAKVALNFRKRESLFFKWV